MMADWPEKVIFGFIPSEQGEELVNDIQPFMDYLTDTVGVEFEAWSQVIRTRDENMEKARRDCPLQREISRRELFRRLRSSGDT